MSSIAIYNVFFAVCLSMTYFSSLNILEPWVQNKQNFSYKYFTIENLNPKAVGETENC